MYMSANPVLNLNNDFQTALASKVAVLKQPGQFELQTRVLPPCAADEVTVRLQGCGVCASSLPVWEGRPWFEYPLTAGAPGHESWGEIVAMGVQVPLLQPELCIGQRVTCFGSSDFSEFNNFMVQEVVPLPAALDDKPFPGEAIGCAMNIFRRAQIQDGQTVAVIGAGFLGLLLVQLAVSAGARVFVLSRREYVRNLALQFGAEAAFDTDSWWRNAHRVVALTNGRGCDRVIEATGLQFALDAATEMMAVYGRLVIAGYHQDGLRELNLQKWNWRAIDVVNAHERDPRRYMKGIADGVAATVEGRIRPQDLLTHSFALEELDTAFQMMIDRPNGFIKGWIRL